MIQKIYDTKTDTNNKTLHETASPLTSITEAYKNENKSTKF